MQKMNITDSLSLLAQQTKRLERLFENGKWQRLSYKKRQQWQRKIERLGNLLKPFNHFAPVRKIVAGAALAVSMAFGQQASAQLFLPVQNAPFNLPSSLNNPSSPTFADLDNDGDLDMLLGELGDYYGANLTYYQNTGTATNPNFAAGQVNPFGLSASYMQAIPTFADIDNDGDLDLFVSDYYGAINYYPNIGTPTAPQFGTMQAAPFGLGSGTYFAFANFVDIDNDGDLDLFFGEYYGAINFQLNTGTATAPNFAAAQVNPFGLQGANGLSMPNFVDFDGDGDLDVFVANSYANMDYYENIGTATTPNFTTPILNPFGISLNTNGDYAFPAFVDIDNDGDLDLFAGVFGSYATNSNIVYQAQGILQPPTSADTAIVLNQNNTHTFSSTDFPFATPNTGQTLTSIKILSLPTSGILKIANAGVAVNQEIFASSLPVLTYQPQAGQFGITTFTFAVSDGFSYSSAQTFTINVNATPTCAPTALTTAQNTDYVFNTADFPFNDPDNGNFQEIQFISLPTKGEIKYNGSPVAFGQIVATANFSNLTYTPLANETGYPYTNFAFAVSDGFIFSTPVTATITVTFPSSTRQIESFATLQLSPNPASDNAVLTVQTQEPKAATLRINHLNGQLVLNQNIRLDHNSTFTIPVSDWAKGVYIVHLRTENGEVWTDKLLID